MKKMLCVMLVVCLAVSASACAALPFEFKIKTTDAAPEAPKLEVPSKQTILSPDSNLSFQVSLDWERVDEERWFDQSIAMKHKQEGWELGILDMQLREGEVRSDFKLEDVLKDAFKDSFKKLSTHEDEKFDYTPLEKVRIGNDIIAYQTVVTYKQDKDYSVSKAKAEYYAAKFKKEKTEKKDDKAEKIDIKALTTIFVCNKMFYVFLTSTLQEDFDASLPAFKEILTTITVW